MELGELDMKGLVETTPNTQLTEEHVITMLYNMLCSISFIH